MYLWHDSLYVCRFSAMAISAAISEGGNMTPILPLEQEQEQAVC